MHIKKQIQLNYIAATGDIALAIQPLFEAAHKATFQSYAPFSEFYVGAAALLSNSEILTGSNQENAAFPSGLCAERVLLNTFSHGYAHEKIVSLVITARSTKYQVPNLLTPCGGCLQVLAEVAKRQNADFEIYTFSEGQGIYHAESLSCFLPFGFELK